MSNIPPVPEILKPCLSIQDKNMTDTSHKIVEDVGHLRAICDLLGVDFNRVYRASTISDSSHWVRVDYFVEEMERNGLPTEKTS